MTSGRGPQQPRDSLRYCLRAAAFPGPSRPHPKDAQRRPGPRAQAGKQHGPPPTGRQLAASGRRFLCLRRIVSKFRFPLSAGAPVWSGSRALGDPPPTPAPGTPEPLSFWFCPNFPCPRSLCLGPPKEALACHPPGAAACSVQVPFLGHTDNLRRVCSIRGMAAGSHAYASVPAKVGRRALGGGQTRLLEPKSLGWSSGPFRHSRR